MTTITGRLFLDGAWTPGRIRVEAGRIASVERDLELSESDPLHIAPGLIDLHVHGFAGCEPLTDLAGMARALARRGTTGFQPTLFPAAPRLLGEQARAVTAAAKSLPAEAATVVGLHLEGPFVNPRSAGALAPTHLAEPSVAGLRAILGPSTGDGHGIRTMTIAPELPGALELVAELVTAGVRPSLGHSLARAAQARAAASAGASSATHLFNAMAPLHHREVGLVGFSLSEDALCAELIGDLVHVGRDAVELALAARGPEGLALVSDALAGAGTGCAVFHSGGRSVRERDGAIWIEEPGVENVLAGAAATQWEALTRLVEQGVVTLEDALLMASTTPARTLGLDGERGRIAPGARADLLGIRLGPLRLERVWLAGVALGQLPD